MKQLLGLLYSTILPGMLAFFFFFFGWQPAAAQANPNVGAAPSIPPTMVDTTQPARLLVKWQAEVQTAGVAGAETGILSSTPTWPLDWSVLEVDAANQEAILARLQNDPRVADVTLDYPLEMAYQPDDPGFIDGAQWGLNQVGADIAWEFSSGQAITVAIIDSGIDAEHPDLAGQVVPGYNFVDDNTDTSDPCGHGTHVAGIVAAATNNTVGVAGIAHQAKLMPIKVMKDNCTGSYSHLMQGILHAVENDAGIIVITSGGIFDHDGLHDAIRFATEQNVAVIVAAGNRGSDEAFYPGSYDESFTVAGTNQNDDQYANSNFGPQIDVAAPATKIFSTYYTDDAGSTYAYMTGTSMAAPHVAGVAALLLALDPDLSLVDLEAAIRQSAEDLGEPGWDPIYGAGRINAWRAVAAISPATGASANVRDGHIRIPTLYTLTDASLTAARHEEGIQLSWHNEEIGLNYSAVIYRSTQPVFESALDLVEIDLANLEFGQGNSYVDRQVEEEVEYFYWVVQVDRDVEMAVSDAATGTFIVQEQEEVQDVSRSIFLPLVQRG